MKEALEVVKQDESSGADKWFADQIPKPTGYKLLISLPEPDKATDGGIIKAAETLQIEEVGSICGRVVEMGPDAYKDPKRFNKPYCKVGDWIVMRSYSGTRFIFRGREMRLVNDDSVEAVVKDHRGISKI